MRVLHLTNHCRFGHGNVHAAVDLACAQTQAGDTVCLASGVGEFVPLLRREGVRYVLLDQERRGPNSLPRLIANLMKTIDEFEPDIVHAHMMTGALLGWFATRFSRPHLVTTVHNAFDRHSDLMRVGDRIIAVSHAVAGNLARRGFPKSKVRVVLNGTLGAPRRDFFERSPIALRHPNVTTICGLHDRKGVPDLLEAFDLASKKVPSAHLYIAGDGPERLRYEEYARSSSSSSRIHFLGELLDTKSLLDSADVFALASHADPCPLVLPEAREAGCAIVATNVDGIPELLEQGRAGTLVPPRSPTALAAAISTLLLEPAALQGARAAAAENLERWSTARVAEDTRQVYLEIAKAGG